MRRGAREGGARRIRGGAPHREWSLQRRWTAALGESEVRRSREVGGDEDSWARGSCLGCPAARLVATSGGVE